MENTGGDSLTRARTSLTRGGGASFAAKITLPGSGYSTSIEYQRRASNPVRADQATLMEKIGHTVESITIIAVGRQSQLMMQNMNT